MEPITTCAAAGAGRSIFFALVALVALLGVGIWAGLGFFVHYYDAANGQREPMAPVRSYLRAWRREWLAELATLLGYPLGLLAPTNLESFAPAGGPPIILIHGYAHNRGSLFALYWRLRRYGYQNVYPINLLPTTAPIAKLGEQLDARIKSISHMAGGQKVIAVAHSMGGLALRWCVKNVADLPVAKAITIGTPHAGTRTAFFGASESTREQRPGSAFLAGLGDSSGLPFVALYSQLDNIVIPASSGAFGDKVVAFTDLGHMTMLFDAEVFDMVLHEVAMTVLDTPLAIP